MKIAAGRESKRMGLISFFIAKFYGEKFIYWEYRFMIRFYEGTWIYEDIKISHFHEGEK